MASPSVRKTKDFNPTNCTVTYFLNIIGGKWKPVLINLIRTETHRYSQIIRAFPEASKQTITNQLRELEADGVIERRVFPEVPPRVEYYLTPYGETLLPVLDAIKVWVKEHMEKHIPHGQEACP
jgi:DNA-binding HxlR family transcriptional regulator